MCVLQSFERVVCHNKVMHNIALNQVKRISSLNPMYSSVNLEKYSLMAFVLNLYEF